MPDGLPRQRIDLPRKKTKLPREKTVLPRARTPLAAGLLAGTLAAIPPAQATMREVYTPGFVDYLKDVEGYGAGYDKKTERYKVYRDVKGIPHIGIGHKLLPKEKYEKGLSKEEVEKLLETDVESHMSKARTFVDNGFGPGSWRKLSPRQKQMLTEYSFNPGLSKFPKFTKAVVEKDWERAYDEMRRYAVRRDAEGNTVEVIPLRYRNRAFYETFLKDLREISRVEREALATKFAQRALEM